MHYLITSLLMYLCLFFSTEPGKFSLFMIVKMVFFPTQTGAVRSVKETLNSQFVDNCKGVIERLTLKEEKMVWNRTTHLW